VRSEKVRKSALAPLAVRTSPATVQSF